MKQTTLNKVEYETIMAWGQLNDIGDDLVSLSQLQARVAVLNFCIAHVRYQDLKPVLMYLCSLDRGRARQSSLPTTPNAVSS